MDRGAWWATVRGVAKVRHSLATKPSTIKGKKITGTKDYRKRSNNSKDIISVVKTPNLVSTMKISLKPSTTGSTGTKAAMITALSDPCDFN